jgi:TetR/AcrR family transcriptional repressor of mexJK operon
MITIFMLNWMTNSTDKITKVVMSKQNEMKPKSVGRPKSNQKRKQILYTASELFLQQGYDRTSMDAVAKASEVSKQTVYSHFKNKDVLYTAVIETKCEEYRIEEATICIETQAIEDILHNIALNFIQLLNDKRVIAMYSVVIGESKYNKHVAELFYDAGPLHSVNLVSRLLVNHPSTQLSIEDAKDAAIDFFNLLKGDYHMRSMLGLDYEQNESALVDYARKVVKKTCQLLTLY